MCLNAVAAFNSLRLLQLLCVAAESVLGGVTWCWHRSCQYFGSAVADIFTWCVHRRVLGSVLCHLGSALLDWCILDAKQLVCFCFVIRQLSVAMQEVFVLWLLECIFHRPSPTNMLIIIGADTVMILSWCVRGVCGCCLHDKRKNWWNLAR